MYLNNPEKGFHKTNIKILKEIWVITEDCPAPKNDSLKKN